MDVLSTLTLSQDGELSDTLYIRGFPRSASMELIKSVVVHANESSHPDIQMDEEQVYIDFSEYSTRNTLRVKYLSLKVAEVRLRALHQYVVLGKVLSAKYELGIDPISKKPKVSGKTHNTIIRKITISNDNVAGSSVLPEKNDDSTPNRRKEKRKTEEIEPHWNGSICKQCKGYRSSSTSSSSAETIPPFNYTYKSIQIHTNDSQHSNGKNISTVEFPFPTGLYLTRVINLTRTYTLQNPLLRLLLNTDNVMNSAMYPKELSECMAMVDALHRTLRMLNFHHLLKQEPVEQVVVYVLGDGKMPLCAASLCLHLPAHFHFHSIDPLLEAIDLTAMPDHEVPSCTQRFHQHKCMSQDFPLPQQSSGKEEPLVSIVIACHSHAPLQEFWSRLCTPKKIAITMPCCANYCDLEVNSVGVDDHVAARLVLSFDDFEVYSAKRKIHIYTNNIE